MFSRRDLGEILLLELAMIHDKTLGQSCKLLILLITRKLIVLEVPNRLLAQCQKSSFPSFRPSRWFCVIRLTKGCVCNITPVNFAETLTLLASRTHLMARPLGLQGLSSSVILWTHLSGAT